MTLDLIFERTFKNNRVDTPPSFDDIKHYLSTIGNQFDHFVGSARDETERKLFADVIDAKRRWYFDLLTAKLTAFESFDTLINAPGGYQPTLRAPSDSTIFSELYSLLANEYDRVQAERGDSRCAHR